MMWINFLSPGNIEIPFFFKNPPHFAPPYSTYKRKSNCCRNTYVREDCHNQRVERAIKLVSQTSMNAAKKEDREGIIQTVISSRLDLPKILNQE